MLIQFQPNGSIVDTEKVTLNPVKAGSVPAYPVVDSQFGGNLTAGNFKYANASAGVARAYWKTTANAVSNIWKMDDDAALDTLLATINTAFDATENLIVVGSDGALYTGS